MIALLYVSRSLIPQEGPDEARALEAIVETAAERNLACRLTGALVHAGGSFAQWLEGPDEEVAQVMASIEADRRHAEVAIVHRAPAAARRFAAWSMVLVHRRPETARLIEAIRTAPGEPERAEAAESLAHDMERGAGALI